MSIIFNYEAADAAKIYDRERYAAGADVIAGLLHVHCGKQLKDIHVLDAGCGTGQYTKALIDHGVGKFTLLDASSEMLNFAKEKLKHYADSGILDDIIQAELPNLPFGDGTFDAVMFLQVFLHLHKSCYVKTIQATKKILRSNGVVLVATVLPGVYRRATWFRKALPAVTENICKAHMTAKEYLDLFTEQGFKCVAAMNFLNRATPSICINYFDHEGPLKAEWRKGLNIFEISSSQVIQEMEAELLELNRKGLLKQLMEDHDHTDETGFSTLFAFKLTE